MAVPAGSGASARLAISDRMIRRRRHFSPACMPAARRNRRPGSAIGSDSKRVGERGNREVVQIPSPEIERIDGAPHAPASEEFSFVVTGSITGESISSRKLAVRRDGRRRFGHGGALSFLRTSSPAACRSFRTGRRFHKLALAWHAPESARTARPFRFSSPQTQRTETRLAPRPRKDLPDFVTDSAGGESVPSRKLAQTR